MINRYHDPLGNDAEKALYEDLAEEIIQWAGWDIIYVQRDNFNDDMLLGRSDGDYRNAKTIEMVLAGESEIDLYNTSLMGKFGLYDNPQVSLHCMVKRFSAIFGADQKPVPGDILWLQHKTNNPRFDEVFEVRKVSRMNPTQFGSYVPVYELSCVHWNMKGERLNTGIKTVDDHDVDFKDMNDNVANESSIIEELVNGLQGLAVDDKDNPFTKSF